MFPGVVVPGRVCRQPPDPTGTTGEHAPHVHEPLHTSWPQRSAFAHARVAPGAQMPPPLQVLNPLHAPQSQVVALHVRVRDCVPSEQLPQPRDSVCVSPGVQVPAPPPLHALQLPNAGHVHAPSHVRWRTREPVPQPPQASISSWISPVAQTPSPSQAHAPHVQSMPHERRSVPQLPHVPPVPISPGEQGPAPVHVPSFSHRPPTQVCRCVPQFMQGVVRAGVPGSQSHVVGAEHSVHTPSVQRSMPAPQVPRHSCSSMRPALGSVSSQSMLTSMPSSSPSVPGTHVPAEQVSPSPQGGEQTPAAASAGSRPPSMRPLSPPRSEMSEPLAHAVITSENAHMETTLQNVLRAARRITRPLNPIPPCTSTVSQSNRRAARARRGDPTTPEEG